MTGRASGGRPPFIAGYQPAGKTIAVIGSLRFAGAFHRLNTLLSLAGAVALPPPVVAPDGDLAPADRATLEAVTRRKIELADEILVVDCNHHIGAATRDEIAYALQLGKPVALLSKANPTLFSECSAVPPRPPLAPPMEGPPQESPPAAPPESSPGVRTPDVPGLSGAAPRPAAAPEAAAEG